MPTNDNQLYYWDGVLTDEENKKLMEIQGRLPVEDLEFLESVAKKRECWVGKKERTQGALEAATILVSTLLKNNNMYDSLKSLLYLIYHQENGNIEEANFIRKRLNAQVSTYAYGDYLCQCAKCSNEFVGSKYSTQCMRCALEQVYFAKETNLALKSASEIASSRQSSMRETVLPRSGIDVSIVDKKPLDNDVLIDLRKTLTELWNTMNAFDGAWDSKEEFDKITKEYELIEAAFNEISTLRDREKYYETTLQFIERWAVYKCFQSNEERPFIEEVLLAIQFDPAIKAITDSRIVPVIDKQAYAKAHDLHKQMLDRISKGTLNDNS